MTHTSPTRFRACALLLIPLALAACSQAPSAPQTSATNGNASAADYPYDGIDRSWTASDDGLGSLKGLGLASGDNQLSGQGWTSATSGWGPVERNKSNGETKGGDGRTLTLNGKTYSTGLGVHANSTVTFALGGQCATFASDIGLDDEVGTRGSAVFQVWADGVKLYDSGKMTGSSATKSLSVSVAGRKELKLVVTDAGDKNYFDHADWANARLLSCTAGSTPAPTPSPAPGGTVTYKAPLVITKGGTYTGNYQSTDPNVPAITVRTSEPVVIDGANLKGPGNLIAGFSMNLTVRNTKGYGVNPNVAGRNVGRFISSEETINLNVTNNYFEGTGGIYVRAFRGNTGAGHTVKILRNSAKNIDGRFSNGAGGYRNDFYRVQFVQFNSVRNVPNVEIAWNQVINEPYKSALEENVNMYESTGTPSSRIKIHDNLIWGAYAPDPAATAGYGGGGILLGDGKGSSMSTAGGWVDVYNNTIISTTNQGIGIAGGHNQNVYNNRVVSAGLLPDGRKIAAQNVGLYVWDQQGSIKGGVWANNTVHDNKVAWMRYSSDGKSSLGNTWFANCTAALCFNNTTLYNTVTLGTEAAELSAWQSRAASNGQKIGTN
ncbi:hypothetical protein HNQ07_001389 [Deinococcus metalli]|uniref:Glycosyl hydrolase family 98 putative carbohydrate-binding module domain-containing protein n=1 Tax=Deinococcus metalli TaxID=1141878 RepID=A0A7W8KD02_9DEIO|nr:NPCBM/NEW2 domain-containing protein [Deinococcus metalli]MBB5375932.1 hypothetical protein [Deinococcus metalli]GHF36000.1 hypothetical protein GCM10017781_10710 [Deinococcus metalli]